MAAQATHKCIVCGTKTDKACAGCRKAGIDICFCSPACQKLIWSRHKLVCGPGKAVPFIWPRLSEQEAADAIQHCKTSLPAGTLEGFFQRAYGIQASELPVRYFESLRMDVDAPVDLYAEDGPTDVVFLQDIAVAGWTVSGDAAWGYDKPAGRDMVLHLLLVYHAVLARLYKPSQRMQRSPMLRNVIDQLEAALAELSSEHTPGAPQFLRDLRSIL